MRSKIFSLSILSMFIVVLFAVFVSADIVFINVTGNSVSVDQGDTATISFKLFENTTGGGDATNIDFGVPITLTSGSNTFNSSSSVTNVITSLSVDATSVVMSLSFDVPSGQAIGTYTGTLQPTGGYTALFEPLAITLTVTARDSFCSSGEINATDLKLKVDINNRGEGDDDEWFPLDLIEIEVELENNKELDGDGDLDDVVFELGLFREGSSTNIIDDMMWISKDDEEFEVGDIDDDGEDKTHLFEFRVDPREVDDDNYILKVKAFPDRDESETCIDFSDNLEDFGSSEFFADIQISKENERDKMVVVDEESYPLVTNAFCGEQVSLSVDVYNVGDRDFDDQIKVVLFNDELGINEEKIANGNFDEGDKTDVTFSFRMPSNAQEKTYTFTMETFYDYDKDDDVYDEVSEDDFDALFKVEGNCDGAGDVSGSKALVAANLESGGKAGEELVVRATVTNTGSAIANYLVNAAGFASWADSASLNPTTFTLSSGESRDVLVTLNVKDDASGNQLFNFEVISDNELVVSQPVSVTIESPAGFFTGRVTGGLGDNSFLWVLGLLNVVLVGVIIFVAVKVLRK